MMLSDSFSKTSFERGKFCAEIIRSDNERMIVGFFILQLFSQDPLNISSGYKVLFLFKDRGK